MKQLSHFSRQLIAVAIIFAACSEEKEGCTSICADNYDASAEIDNGTCIGCRDITATNYCSGAILNNNNCIYECEVNQTGRVYFINNSNSNSTYDIIWDGAKLTTITPGETSITYTITANITHTLVFRFTNTSTDACTSSAPVIPQCQTIWYSCTG